MEGTISFSTEMIPSGQGLLLSCSSRFQFLSFVIQTRTLYGQYEGASSSSPAQLGDQDGTPNGPHILASLPQSYAKLLIAKDRI